MVVRKKSPLAKSRARGLIATGLNRAVLRHGIEEVAGAGGCSVRCIQKALAHETMPEAHTLANILDLDETALDELFAEKGKQLVTLKSEITDDMMLAGGLAHFIGELCEALRDMQRSPRETCQLADLIRPIIPQLNGIVREADEIRNGSGLRAVA